MTLIGDVLEGGGQCRILKGDMRNIDTRGMNKLG